MAIQEKTPEDAETIKRLEAEIAKLTAENKKLADENHDLKYDRKLIMEDLVGLRNKFLKVVDSRVHVDNKFQQQIQSSR